MTLDDNSNSDSPACSNGSDTAHGKEGGSSSNDDSRTSLELRELMDSLPQELYDQIYDLTFTAEPKIRIYSGKDIDEDLVQGFAKLERASLQRVVKLNEAIPRLLHVDRASRKKFAASYFGHPDSIFVFYFGRSPGMCIALTHLRLMKDIRVGENCDVDAMCLYLYHELPGPHRACLQVGIDDIVALVEERAGAAGENASEFIAPTSEAVDGSARR